MEEGRNWWRLLDKLILSRDVKKFLWAGQRLSQEAVTASRLWDMKVPTKFKALPIRHWPWRSKRMWWELCFEGFRRHMMHSLVNKGGDLGLPFALTRSPRGREQRSDGMRHVFIFIIFFVCAMFLKSHSAFKKWGWEQREHLESCCNSPGIHFF